MSRVRWKWPEEAPGCKMAARLVAPRNRLHRETMMPENPTARRFSGIHVGNRCQTATAATWATAEPSPLSAVHWWD